MAASTWLLIWFPYMLVVAPAVWGYTMSACVSVRNEGKQNVPCTGGKYKIETISEMVARSSTTAALFSGAAAISLIGISIALKDIYRGYGIQGAARDAVQGAFYIGALGYVGLTVWSIRVDDGIHTGFTAQTLCMMTLLCTILCIHIYDSLSRGLCVLLVVSLLAYGTLYGAKEDWPINAKDYTNYFDFDKYYRHAPAQYCFVSFYYILLGRLHHICPNRHAQINTQTYETKTPSNSNIAIEALSLLTDSHRRRR